MISIFVINTKDKTPIYTQLCRQLRDQVAMGLLAPGTPLPSVRQLSSELGINPNTIQRAYRMMEEEGLTISVPGKGSFVADNTAEMQQQLIRSQIEKTRIEVKKLKQLSVSRSDAAAIVNEVYGGNE